MKRKLGGISFRDGIILIDLDKGAGLSWKKSDGEFGLHKFLRDNSRFMQYPIYRFLYFFKLYISSMTKVIGKTTKSEKVAISMMVLIGFSFMISVPYLMSETIIKSVPSSSYLREIGYNAVRTIGKLLLFIIYALILKYFANSSALRNHSAEHKLINCVESGLEVNEENVKKQSHFNPRCGTTFLLLDGIVGIFFFGIMDGIIKTFYYDYHVFSRIMIHLLFTPLFIFLTVYLHKFYVKLISNNRFLSIFILFQKFSLKEADDESIKLAIMAYKELEREE